MKVYKIIVLFISAQCCVADVHGDERDVANTLDSSIEKVLTKLNELHGKVVELESTVKQTVLKLSSDMDKISQRMDEKLSGVFDAINEQNETIARILSTQQDHFIFAQKQGVLIDQRLVGVTNEISALQVDSKRFENPASPRYELASKEDQALRQVYPFFRNFQNITFRSCAKVPPNLSGKYTLQPTPQDEPFLGYCEHSVVHGGGWLVFQYRYDGSEDFYRNWTDYKNGFGSLDSEFWLGLERLHRLTSARPHELLVELRDFEGKYTYARYNMFKIGSEEEKYALQELGMHTGTAQEVLSYHMDRKFSTADQDNDLSGENCAFVHKGAWWYNNCAVANLNGPFSNNEDFLSMHWGMGISMAQAYSRMMIREV